MTEPLVVADLFDRFDIQRMLLMRAKGLTAEEVADNLNYDRVEVIRILRIIADICR